MIKDVILATLTAWLIAQLIKGIIISTKTKKIKLKYFFVNGHFPSSHASVVCALSTGILFEEGFSLLFLTSLVFSLIVLSDSFGLRQNVKKNSMKLWKLKNDDNMIGHNFKEVVAGALIGILTSITIFLV